MNCPITSILLVGNDLANVRRVSKLLQESQQLKIEISRATRIDRGIDLLQQKRFDLILLAHPQSAAGNLANIETFKQHVPQLPVIVLSQFDDLDSATESIRLGAQDYLIEAELESKMLTRSIQLAIERQRHLFAISQQALMKKMLDRIRQSNDPKAISSAASKIIREFLRCDCGFIYSFERAGEIEAANGNGYTKPELLQSIQQFVAATNFSDLPTLFSQSAIVCSVKDTHNCPDRLPIDPQLIRSCLLLPIWRSPPTAIQNSEVIPENGSMPHSPSKKIWGIAIAYNIKDTRHWWDWEIDFLQNLTAEVRIEIHQSQLCHRLEADNQKLQQLAIEDGLTKIANRRYFDLVLDKEWQRLAREKLPLSLVLCDVDHFKAYNDTYGHQEGDRCLRKIALILKECSRRPADLVARYGGEEFALILPNTDASGALFIAHKIVRRLEKHNIPHLSSPVSQAVTMSLGIATRIPRPKQPTSTIIEVADNFLYQAKKAGRNQLAADNWLVPKHQVQNEKKPTA